MTATLPYPALCLVTDRSVCPPEQLPARVAAAFAGGVDLVQLRDKELPGATCWLWRPGFGRLCRPTPACW